MIIIYTDGSAKKNGAKDAIGGFSVIVCEGPDEANLKIIDIFVQREKAITNNQMELKAILWAIEHYGAQPFSKNIPIIYTDSMYCINSFTKWIDNWKRNGWTKSGNKPLENKELMQKYDKLTSQDKYVELRYVPGHKGVIWNELADKLATGELTEKEVIEIYGR